MIKKLLPLFLLFIIYASDIFCIELGQEKIDLLTITKNQPLPVAQPNKNTFKWLSYGVVRRMGIMNLSFNDKHFTIPTYSLILEGQIGSKYGFLYGAVRMAYTIDNINDIDHLHQTSDSYLETPITPNKKYGISLGVGTSFGHKNIITGQGYLFKFIASSSLDLAFQNTLNAIDINTPITLPVFGVEAQIRYEHYIDYALALVFGFDVGYFYMPANTQLSITTPAYGTTVNWIIRLKFV